MGIPVVFLVLQRADGVKKAVQKAAQWRCTPPRFLVQMKYWSGTIFRCQILIFVALFQMFLSTDFKILLITEWLFYHLSSSTTSQFKQWHCKISYYFIKCLLNVIERKKKRVVSLSISNLWPQYYICGILTARWLITLNLKTSSEPKKQKVQETLASDYKDILQHCISEFLRCVCAPYMRIHMKRNNTVHFSWEEEADRTKPKVMTYCI